MRRGLAQIRDHLALKLAEFSAAPSVTVPQKAMCLQ
jgi:hypothetical protein